MWLALQSVVGILAVPAIALALSEERRLLPAAKALRIIAGAIAVQIVIALILLKVPASRLVFDGLSQGVLAIQNATDNGAQLVFGYLAGAPAPFDMTKPEHNFVLAARVFPMILVLSAIVRLLYYWGVLQKVVAGFAYLLRRSLGTGGPLSTVSAASIFLGIIEAPLMIRPYLSGMGRGAFFATMCVAMATVAGTVMALYASILSPLVPGAAGHLLAASLMNVPAALMIARLMVPRDFEGGPDTAVMGDGEMSRSAMDAVAQGTVDGLRLVATVAALLIVIVSLVALINSMLAFAGGPFGVTITLQSLLGALCRPLAWMIGIPWAETATAGALLGQKVVLNEFLAYLELAKTPPGVLTERSRVILTYAMCSFANLGSLGILIGGLAAMAPERRTEIAELAPRSVVAGFLASLLSAAIVGMITVA
ncbi:MAG: nucleoside transporter C-terminal domain-containing protein [Hyphomicrobium sp.]